MDMTMHKLLVQYPLVREDAPEWKKICPFCGAYDLIHEAGNTYVCHNCHANLIENDTASERQIQIIALNKGTMPALGVGQMPIVLRDDLMKPQSSIQIDLANDIVIFRNRHGKVYAVRDLDEWMSVTFAKGGACNGKRNCA